MPYTATKGSKLSLYCSSKCGNAAFHWRYARAKKPTTCVGCGVLFSALIGHGKRKTCSDECQRTVTKEEKRSYKARRRARKKKATISPVRTLTVFVRDGWMCQSCGCATPQLLRGSLEWNAPELDHIVPLSKGGAHSEGNCQCLCRTCNQLKGTHGWDEFRTVMQREAA
jgi:5-methylcytosine-specific restriction endonuclease McrA